MHQAAGRAAGDVTRAAALDHLADGIAALGEGAAGRGHPPFYEPLNRHETNLFNRQAEAADFIRGRALGIVDALERIGYEGYLSSEVFPLPIPLDAARQSVAGVRSIGSYHRG